MTCKCGSNRILKLTAKCDDRCDKRVDHLNYHRDGNVPYLDFLGGGDYLQISVCLDCGVLQKFTPVDDEELKDELRIK